MSKRAPSSIFGSLFDRLRPKKSDVPSRTVPKHPKTATPSTARPFQAISIYHGTVCCATAKKISGYRFLAKNAPTLPLQDCTMSRNCECRYIKHSDRRGDSRRLDDFDMKSILFAAQEKRKSRGRRAKD